MSNYRKTRCVSIQPRQVVLAQATVSDVTMGIRTKPKLTLQIEHREEFVDSVRKTGVSDGMLREE